MECTKCSVQHSRWNCACSSRFVSKMKAAAVILLFICASEAASNWLGQPQTDLKELENLFEDTKSLVHPARFASTATVGNLAKTSNKYGAEQNDHHEDGSGVNPIDGSKFSKLSKAINGIIEFVNQISKEKDEISHESAKKFVEALKYEKEDDKVKSSFGKGIRKQFESCEKIMLEFAKAAQESGLFEKIEHEEVDFAEIVEKIINQAENEEGSIIHGLFSLFNNHTFKDHPGVKVIKQIGTLIGETACDLTLEGYLGEIKKLFMEIKNQQADENDYRRSWRRKIADHCIDIRDDINKQPNSPMQRAARCMFDRGCTLREAWPTGLTVSIIKDAIKLGGKVALLTQYEKAYAKRKFNKIDRLYDEGNIEGADLELAHYVLRDMRISVVAGSILFPHDRQSDPGDEHISTFVEDETTENLSGTEAQ